MDTNRLETQPMKATPGQRAFTLIELMIVVAIIAIIAAVAYPAYTQHIIKARRSDAEGALLNFANAMERYYTENGTYLGAASGGGNTGAPKVFATQAPVDGSSKVYNLTINAATATTYTLRATPIGGSAQDGDGFLQVTQTGARAWDKDNDGSIGSGENSW